MIDVSQVPPEGLDVKLRIVKRGPVWTITRFRRCPGCYLPTYFDFQWDAYRCSFCGGTVTTQWIEGMPRWRRWLDRLTGMHF